MSMNTPMKKITKLALHNLNHDATAASNNAFLAVTYANRMHNANAASLNITNIHFCIKRFTRVNCNDIINAITKLMQ